MLYLRDNKVQFIIEAGRILASTLDYNVTLASVAKLVVESVGDFCIIDILEENEMKRVVVKVARRQDHEFAHKMFSYPPDPRNKEAIYDAAVSGMPILIKKVTPKWLKTVSQIREERAVVKKLRLKSMIFAPLISRGKIIGVITIGSQIDGFSYSSDDVDFITALAGRAALAVDNARLYTQVESALQSRDEFLSIASHELKTPLTSILLALQYSLRHLRKDNFSDEKILNALETGVTQTRRLSALMSDLLNISVIKSGKVSVEKEEADIIQIINDTISGFKLLLIRKNLEIKLSTNEKEIVGMWDKIRIGEVISNLISNAIKYGNNAPIIIDVKLTNKKVIIKIKDKGIGINKEDAKKIFDLFKRTDAAREFKGMGVGLYISNQIVEAHGGKLTVTSTVGKGSIFNLELPR